MRCLALLVLLAACGDHGGSIPTDAPVSIDAAPDAPPPRTCDGACRTTALTATFGSVTRSLDVAYYGILTREGAAIVHVEAYKGAAPGCPTRSSPRPEYVVIFNAVGVVRSGSAVYMFDFMGDLLAGHASENASSVTAQTTAADPGVFTAIEASLTFAAGTIAGHLYATHCDSLDATL